MRRTILFGLAACCLALPCGAALTTVQDTLYTATGGYCSGTLTLSWQTFTAPEGHTVYAGSTEVAIAPAVNGLTVTLEPGQYTASYAITPTGCVPAYEQWIVPVSSGAVNLAAVRSIVAPTPYSLISLGWLAQGGATTGQTMCWLGASWGPGLCGGGVGSVSSVFGRIGAVVATSGDYSYSQITGTPNLAVYAPLASPALTGTPTAPTASEDNGSTQVATTAYVDRLKARAIGFAFDGAGSALTTSNQAYFTVPFACAISAWNATVDTGTATWTVWKVASGSAIPTSGNSIVASAAPAISSGTAARSATLTGWTTAVSANDIFGIGFSAVSSATRASLVLECDQ
jgi:hypothetical protein